MFLEVGTLEACGGSDGRSLRQEVLGARAAVVPPNGRGYKGCIFGSGWGGSCLAEGRGGRKLFQVAGAQPSCGGGENSLRQRELGGAARTVALLNGSSGGGRVFG